MRALAAAIAAVAALALTPALAHAELRASFECSPKCAAGPGETLTFTSTSTSSVPIRSYEWDLDGDGLYGDADDPDEPHGETANDAQHAFAEPGSYFVGLRVRNANNELGAATEKVTVKAKPQPGHIVGTPGSDVLVGTKGKDVLHGLGGNDRLVGRGGPDILIGGPGNDLMKAGPGKDQIIAGDGRDRGKGQSGKDRLYDVDSRRDRFVGGGGKDVFFGTKRKVGPPVAEVVQYVGKKPIVSSAGSCFGVCSEAELVLTSPAGGEAKELEVKGRDPAWSPNGVTIAFDKSGDIRTVNWDGTGVKHLTGAGIADESDDYSPAWSPDGSKIAFVRDGQIWVMAKNGSNQVQLTGYPEHFLGNADPTWTPDGTRIWFSRRLNDAPDGPHDYDLWSMNPDGTAQAPATDSDVHDTGAAFSPSGDLLAWATGEDYDGSNGDENVMLRVLGLFPVGLADGLDPAFSPSGQQVVFRGAETYPGLYRVDVGGSNLKTLAPGGTGGYTRDPSWRW